MDSSSSARTYGFISSAVFFGLIVLILLVVSLSVPMPVQIPPEGIDIVTEIEALPGGGMPSGGGSTAPEVSSSGGSVSENVISSENSSNTNVTRPSNTTENRSEGTNWNDMWSNSNNTNSSSSGTGGGNGGDGPGGEGHGGRGKCKGCYGSGTSLGNGDATRLIVPKVNNQDEGVIVVKVKIDKNGTVVEAKEYGQQGTYGNLSESSYREARNSAMKTQFAPEPGISEYRTGYIKYNFHRN